MYRQLGYTLLIFAMLLGWSSVAQAESCVIAIPHLTGGTEDWNELLQVDNAANEQGSYTLILYNLQGLTVYTSSFTVPAFGYVTLDLSKLSPLATSGIIQSCNGNLNFRIDYIFQASEGVAEFNLNLTTPASSLGFYFSNAFDFVAWKGLAVMNTGSETENVIIYAMGNGQILDSVTAVIQPKSKIVGIHSQWFPNIDNTTIEKIVVRGERSDLAGITISGSMDNAQMLFSSASSVSEPVSPLPKGEYIVLAWNDLGMHCLNPTYDKAVILPPYNTVWAQVIRKGAPPEVITQGVQVDYRIINNTTSSNKRSYGQFWTYDLPLFGVDLPTDKGLNLSDPAIHNGLSGRMLAKNDHFQVDGIPVTPVDDAGVFSAYQVAEITVKETASGKVLAQTRATVPTSDEINCAKCHGTNAFDNILSEHKKVGGQSLSSMAPVLCAKCHGSPALGSAPGDRGSAGKYLSEAIHSSHANRNAKCYDCHPGGSTKCNRSIPHDAADGNCITCHGTMGQLAGAIKANTKIPWVDEPKCVTCHKVSGVDSGSTLYRNAKGHGGLYCAGCHHSPHATVPSRIASDNYGVVQYQNAMVSLGSCKACHSSSKGPDDEGSSLDMEEFMEKHGGTNPERLNSCHACHTSLPSGSTTQWPHQFGWKAR